MFIKMTMLIQMMEAIIQYRVFLVTSKSVIAFYLKYFFLKRLNELKR